MALAPAVGQPAPDYCASVVSETVRRLRVQKPVLDRFLALQSTTGDVDVDRRVEGARTTGLNVLPSSVRQELVQLRNRRLAVAAVHIQGLLCDAECAPGWSVDEVAAAENVVLAVGTVLGEPVGYASEKSGVLVQHVFPVESEASTPSNESSSFELDLHTELVFSRRHPERPMDALCPHFIVLACLRGDPAARTVIVSNRDLVASLDQSDVDLLRSGMFELQAPYSFTRDGDRSRPWTDPVALLTGPDSDPCLAMDLACGTRAISAEGERALEALRRAAAPAERRVEISLAAGDVLVLDNRRCLHGRSSFTARFDESDRWLLRGYVRASLEPAGRIL